MVISERVDDMSVDEILTLPGIKPPQPLDRCAIRIGQARMSWCGSSPDRIGHAVVSALPAATRPDGSVDGPQCRRRGLGSGAMKLPEPYGACSCRDPATGRLLGKACPELERRGHGAWYARYEAPRGMTQRHRRPRLGPYRSKDECKYALGRLGQGAHVEDRRTTFGEYLRALRKFTSVMSGVSAGERAAGCSSIPRGRRVA